MWRYIISRITNSWKEDKKAVSVLTFLGRNIRHIEMKME